MPANYMDPRSTVGRMSRGNNIYRGVSNAPRTGAMPTQPTQTGRWPTAGGWGGNAGASWPSAAPSSTPPPAPMQPYVPPPGYYPTPAPTGMGDYNPSSIIGASAHGVPYGPGGGGGPLVPPGLTYEQYLAQVMAGLPGLDTFDPLYEELIRILEEQSGVLDVRQERETDRINNMYDVILARLQENLGRTLEANEFSMADQGILRSGINVRQQGRISENFGQQEADALGQQAATLEQLISQISDARNQLVQEGQRAEIERAERAQAAQQQQAQAAAQAAAYMYAAQLQSQQPVPNNTGQYQPAPPAPAAPAAPTSPPITLPPTPSFQPPIPGINMLGGPTLPYSGGPTGAAQAPNFISSFRPDNTSSTRAAPPAPAAPSRQTQSSWNRTPISPRTTRVTQPLSGAIERRLRRF